MSTKDEIKELKVIIGDAELKASDNEKIITLLADILDELRKVK